MEGVLVTWKGTVKDKVEVSAVNGEDGRDRCPRLGGNRAVEIGVVYAGRGDHDL